MAANDAPSSTLIDSWLSSIIFTAPAFQSVEGFAPPELASTSCRAVPWILDAGSLCEIHTAIYHKTWIHGRSCRKVQCRAPGRTQLGSQTVKYTDDEYPVALILMDRSFVLWVEIIFWTERRSIKELKVWLWLTLRIIWQRSGQGVIRAQGWLLAGETCQAAASRQNTISDRVCIRKKSSRCVRSKCEDKESSSESQVLNKMVDQVSVQKFQDLQLFWHNGSFRVVCEFEHRPWIVTQCTRTFRSWTFLIRYNNIPTWRVFYWSWLMFHWCTITESLKHLS